MSQDATLFDDLDEESTSQAVKPFFTLPLDDQDPEAQKAVHDWLKQELGHLNDLNRSRFDEIRKDMAWYKGVHGALESEGQDDSGRTTKRRQIQKVDSNDTFDLLESRVARMVKYKPAVAIMPANDEHSDKIGAKACKNLLDYIWYSEKFEDEQVLEIVTNTMSMGEVYVLPVFDPDKGDLHPEFVEKYAEGLKKGLRQPLLGEDGQPDKDERGNPIYVDKEVRVGDVTHKIVLTTDVRLQKRKRYADVDYMFLIEEMPAEEARLRWPNQADKVKDGGGADEKPAVFDVEEGMRKCDPGNTLIVTLLHRKTKTLPKGRKIVFTMDGILENGPLPYSTARAPWVRLTDDDFTGDLHGRSFIRRLRGLVSARSKLTNMILRNIFLVSHPKWMLPAGSAKLDSLANDITIVQFKGPHAPQLVQANPTPREVFLFRDQLGTETMRKAGIGEISRGNPPPGIKAFVALQFLSEQEQELFNRLILKFNSFVKTLAELDLACAGDNYEPDDKRMIRVQGKNNRWMSVFFDVSHLSKPYDIRLQNSSALPQSKGARIQALMDLSKEFPGLIPQEQLIEMIDLGQNEKFVDSVTVAVRTAEAENEAMMELEASDGDSDEELPIADPEEYEDHLAHWPVHARLVQDWAFKYQTPPENQKVVLDHLRTTEMLMAEKARQNPEYLKRVAALPGFPLVFMPEELAPKDPDALAASGSPAAIAAAVPPGADPTVPPSLMPPAALPPELPVNPALGDEPQLDVAPTPAPLEQQLGLETQADPGQST